MNRLLIKRQAKASLKGKWGSAIGFNIVTSIMMFIIPAVIFIVAVGSAQVSNVAQRGDYAIDDFFAAFFTGTSLILFIVSMVIGVVIVPLFAYAASKAFLGANRGGDIKIGGVFDGFKDKPAKTFFTGVLAYIVIYLCYYIPASFAGALVAHVAPRAKSVANQINAMNHGRAKFFMENIGIQMFTAMCIFGVAILIGMTVSFAYSMVFYVRVDNPDIGVVGALRQSRKIMHGRKLSYFGLQISFIGWVIISVITFGIGFFWLVPYILSANSAFYDDAKDNIIE